MLKTIITLLMSKILQYFGALSIVGDMTEQFQEFLTYF